MDIFNYDNRDLKILNLLEENFYVQEKYLIDVLKVSAKTIQNEIKGLNKSFQNAAYIKKENLKYTLYIVKLEEYLLLKKNIYERYFNFDSSKVRLVYIFKKLAELHEPYILDELAYEMTVSRGTLVSDVKKLKDVLKEYNIKISGKTNSGIKLSGSEKDIRFYILENIFNYVYKEDIFDMEDHKYIDSLAEKHSIEKQGLYEFFRYLTVSLDRFANGFFIDLTDSRYEELKEEYTNRFIEDVCNYIQKRYNIELDDNEKKFIAISYATMRLPSSIKMLTDNIKSVEEYNILLNDILANIYYEYSLDIDVSTIKEEFIYHLYFMIKRLKYGVRYTNNMKEVIMDKYPISFKIAKTAGKIISAMYSYDISIDEICYLAIYFETFISNIGNDKTIRVLIITNASKAYRNLMVQELRSISRENIEVDSVTESDSDVELNNYDLIISTVKKEFNTNSMVIYQNTILDMEYIKKEINLARYIGKMNIPQIRGMESLILSTITDETFYILDSSLTYEENLSEMIGRLYRQGLVDEYFEDRIREREKKSSMMFTHSIAFPHTTNKFTDSILIAVGVCERGCIDNENLRLVFLAALPENSENSTALVRTYDELISIIREENVIEDISKLGSYDDLVSYFINKTNLYR